MVEPAALQRAEKLIVLSLVEIPSFSWTLSYLYAHGAEILG